MARGKKTTDEEVVLIMSAWAKSPNNLNEVARLTGKAYNTVKAIVEKYQNEERFEKLRKEKAESFSKKADRIIDKALARLERDIDDDNKDIPVNQLTTAIGTLTDKKLLLEGKPTENTKITFDLPPEVKQYAE